MINNNTLLETSWKAMEYWHGSFYFTEKSGKGQKNLKWEVIRDKSLKHFCCEATKYLKEKQYEQADPCDEVKIIVPQDLNRRTVKEDSDLIRKYVRIPIFSMNVGSFRCKIGIRVNFCALPNLSKIFIYFLTLNEDGHWNNNDLESFLDGAKSKSKELTDEVFRIYSNAVKTTTNYTIKSTSYHLELYNLGTTDKNVIEFTEAQNIELMKQLLLKPDVKKSYYTMVSLAGEKFGANKRLDILKNELMKLPKQALIPSTCECDDVYVQSIYAQTENPDLRSGAILLAGITAIDERKIKRVNWMGISDENVHNSPFCRVKKDLTNLEAWHHSTSSQLVISYAAI